MKAGGKEIRPIEENPTSGSARFYQSEFENCYSFPMVRASARANRSTVVG